MPGKVSLFARRYYAHPQNLFWPLLSEVLGMSPFLAYEEKLREVQSAKIALWDVLASCVRASSLDSDIESDSLEPNDFAEFFSNHPKIIRVFFNGAKAEKCYRKLVIPHLGESAIACKRLPSTSPANARISYANKLDVWREIVMPCD
jgi:hypoxanthine-DNA glycosylase